MGGGDNRCGSGLVGVTSKKNKLHSLFKATFVLRHAAAPSCCSVWEMQLLYNSSKADHCDLLCVWSTEASVIQGFCTSGRHDLDILTMMRSHFQTSLVLYDGEKGWYSE